MCPCCRYNWKVITFLHCYNFGRSNGFKILSKSIRYLSHMGHVLSHLHGLINFIFKLLLLFFIDYITTLNSLIHLQYLRDCSCVNWTQFLSLILLKCHLGFFIWFFNLTWILLVFNSKQKQSKIWLKPFLLSNFF